MDHADHVRLLRDGVPRAAGVWADLGAGSGAFTLALADLLPAGSTIHAVDTDLGALAELERSYTRFRRGREVAALVTHNADVTKDLALPPLDGVVMANSLHFVKDKAPLLARVKTMQRPGKPFLLVEYDADQGNHWVPYPLSFETWRRVGAANGFAEPRLLDAEPSRFLRRIYSAATTG